MTNAEIENRLRLLVAQERKVTGEILKLICDAEKRQIYLERGYGSLLDWLVRSFGYSQAAAYRRIHAAELLEAVPEVSHALVQGKVTLSTLSELQSASNREKKQSGHDPSEDKKRKVLAKIENKSYYEAQKVIAEAFPFAIKKKETLRAVNAEELRLSIVLSEQETKNLKRAREILSHSHPLATWAEVIDHVIVDFLERKDPLRKMTHGFTEAVNGCVIPINLRRTILQRSGGQCEFTDPLDRRRCESRYQIEIDHIHPKALGGSNRPENLRALCRAHNAFEAKRILGSPQPHLPTFQPDSIALIALHAEKSI